KGGKAAHQKGTAHEWTSEEARDAGRKGGIASHQRRREQSGTPSSDVASDDAIAMDRSSSPDSSSGSSSYASGSSMDRENPYGSERSSASEPSSSWKSGE